MGGPEPRRIVAGGSHGGNADAVLVAVDRAVELPATDHHVPLRPLAICRFGVELDADGIGVETTKENLDADVVSGVLRRRPKCAEARSEEHTSELQSQSNLVCRLLLEKKKKARASTRRRICYT